MGPAVRVVDVVGIGHHIFCVSVVILEGDFHDDIIRLRHDAKHIGCEGCLSPVEILDKLNEPVFKMKRLRPIGAFVTQSNATVSYTHLTLPTNREV